MAAIVLAAGASRRMRGRDKLMEPVGGRPALRAVAEVAKASRADAVVVVLPPAAAARREALAGLGVAVVEAADWAEGMAASIRAGLAAAGEADAVVILLADMPEVTAGDVDRLIAAFDPEEGREICRAVSADGTPGHPVLFGRRFFEALAGLSGDRGAREVRARGGGARHRGGDGGAGGGGRPRHARGLGGLAGSAVAGGGELDVEEAAVERHAGLEAAQRHAGGWRRSWW